MFCFVACLYWFTFALRWLFWLFNIDVCAFVVDNDVLLFRFAMDILFRLMRLFVVVGIAVLVLVWVLGTC